MYLLREIPQGGSAIKPVPFLADSHAALLKVSRAVRNYYKDRTRIVQQWADFEKNYAPQSDDVYEHIKRWLSRRCLSFRFLFFFTDFQCTCHFKKSFSVHHHSILH
jgi:hypothetical protein